MFSIEPSSTKVAGMVCFSHKAPSVHDFSSLLSSVLEGAVNSLPSHQIKAMIGTTIELGTGAPEFDPINVSGLLRIRKRKPDILVVWSVAENQPNKFDWALSLDKDGKIQIAGPSLVNLAPTRWIDWFCRFSEISKVAIGIVEELPAKLALARFGIGGGDLLPSELGEFWRFQEMTNHQIVRVQKKLPLDEALWDVGQLNFLNAYLLSLQVKKQTLHDWICEGPSYRGELSGIGGSESTLWTVEATNIRKVRSELGDLVVCREPSLGSSIKGWAKRTFG